MQGMEGCRPMVECSNKKLESLQWHRCVRVRSDRVYATGSGFQLDSQNSSVGSDYRENQVNGARKPAHAKILLSKREDKEDFDCSGCSILPAAPLPTQPSPTIASRWFPPRLHPSIQPDLDWVCAGVLCTSYPDFPRSPCLPRAALPATRVFTADRTLCLDVVD